MSARSFALSLLVFTLFWSALLGALTALSPGARAHWPMAAGASGLFILICIALFLAGKSAARSANKNTFTGVVLVSVFAKMALSLALLLAYRETVHPVGKWFVGLFLLSYVAYTAFEIWVLLRIARQKTSK